jgi:hypothetical protein
VAGCCDSGVVKWINYLHVKYSFGKRGGPCGPPG